MSSPYGTDPVTGQPINTTTASTYGAPVGTVPGADGPPLTAPAPVPSPDSPQQNAAVAALIYGAIALVLGFIVATLVDHFFYGGGLSEAPRPVLTTPGDSPAPAIATAMNVGRVGFDWLVLVGGFFAGLVIGWLGTLIALKSQPHVSHMRYFAPAALVTIVVAIVIWAVQGWGWSVPSLATLAVGIVGQLLGVYITRPARSLPVDPRHTVAPA